MLFEFPSNLAPHSGETKRALQAVRARARVYVCVECVRVFAHTCERM